MAMAEEQRLQEGHRLCANNCGFFGSPATLNLCSKCSKESPSAAAGDSLHPPFSPAGVSVSAGSSAGEDRRSPPDLTLPPPPPAAAIAGRCAACRRKVGLAGFTCRCGATCCGSHRFPEQHECGFDFRAAGREGIARANPVVKAEKLDRI